MRFSDLLDEATAANLGDLDIAGVTADSRDVREGYAFFAVPGHAGDGLAYVADARARGARVIIAPRAAEVGLPLLVVADVRAALAHAAARFFARQPRIVAAVTGTSGKSSVVDFLRQIWLTLGRDAASLGTIGIVDKNGAHYGSLTTPGPVALHQSLDELAARGVTHLAMEASSLGIDQRRLDGVRLTVGAFTNFSRDHLDHHRDLEEYFEAKMRLFDTLLAPGQTAVIDADSSVAARVIDICEKRGLTIFDVGEKGRGIALLEADAQSLGSRLRLRCGDETFAVALPLAGAFQISNALVAAGMAIACGAAPAQVFGALETLRGAPGRLELIGARDGAPVFVDYAHKPDALDKVLAAVRPLAKGRLVVVFGAGGDRDRGKRPLMGEIAARAADVVVVTDDNPRSEEPASIRAAILEAARGAKGAEIHEIGDRAAAIRAAVSWLREGDALVVAGKGHETGQIVGDQVLPFSDRAAVEAALQGGI
ncbi:UDP-N-acetylmuramoyl-L-alanyl-D-glutamate--2,6-diaminopimelate ligase [Methylosinus sporium]|uniref:UDP-N-acetylmuramoyl-L-alanyl-D-glutamate--2,6-diaminopimelate ligase n=1 Tax=Methylosinus sporium TaxID=428 RepID=A0A549T3Y9_METSR|nr:MULTISPECIES: UDP-N-acetylmuramoyl-L-alanyl-D-glutamate--2,6-diaminopimelate ligase [Methylosinus]MBU3889249.1 UDP-N-acetylmuramoyl-L-alanyl-D-glutamate--2,6-diaminopimelate ligase [Methylosinus sp. KRF6]TRL36625.1 UDP-N-acetylmuramoyl-L-alanyl-D-glutamate--2,6-diaminopimelate ligase [Methylosinus sporium]